MREKLGSNHAETSLEGWNQYGTIVLVRFSTVEPRWQVCELMCN